MSTYWVPVLSLTGENKMPGYGIQGENALDDSSCSMKPIFLLTLPFIGKIEDLKAPRNA